MGIAAYNRGSKALASAAAEQARPAMLRADRIAEKDEAQRLRDRILTLERDLGRARRCIAELRRSKEAPLSEARSEASRSDSAVRILARVAFPSDAEVA